MLINLFGYQFGKIIADNSTKKDSFVSNSPIPKEIEDGSQTITTGGFYGQYVDIDGVSGGLSEKDLIAKYRSAAAEAECDHAVNSIVDEAIVSDDDSAPVTLILDDLEYSDELKKEIFAEFDKVVTLLDFNRKGSEIFKQWYVDGRTYYHLIIDEAHKEKGILELRYVDPTKINKVREVETVTDPKTRASITTVASEYFVYSDNISSTAPANAQVSLGTNSTLNSGVTIPLDLMIYIPSGILDVARRRVISYLHKALKAVNQLRMMEDSLVIYRIARAPERRIFYVDIGNLPKGKAEEYMQSIMAKYRNKLIYDASTGAIRDDRRHMSMLEDFWIPRREGGRSTEITTLPSGTNLGEIDDILYFKKALYQCMNVPISRFDVEATYNVGRSTEVSREEVSFQKFVNRLRKKFSYLFIDILHKQLILKGIITEDDWSIIKEKLRIDFQRDNFFTELKDMEIISSRTEVLDKMSGSIGKYYSNKWIRRNILKQSDEDIVTIDKEIADESNTQKPKEGSEDLPPEEPGSPAPDEQPEETPPKFDPDAPETDAPELPSEK